MGEGLIISQHPILFDKRQDDFMNNELKDNVWQSILQLGGCGESDMKGDVALQILPYLLPGSSYNVAKNRTRPTLDEAKTYFIDKKPVGTNMPE